jgi:hypothetical protein
VYGRGMRTQLGVPDVIQPSVEPIGAYHKPISIEHGGFAYPRGATNGIKRIGR